jgi:hypothetical protein
MCKYPSARPALPYSANPVTRPRTVSEWPSDLKLRNDRFRLDGATCETLIKAESSASLLCQISKPDLARHGNANHRWIRMATKIDVTRIGNAARGLRRIGIEKLGNLEGEFLNRPRVEP